MTWTRRSRYTYDARKKDQQRRKQKGGSMATWTRRSRYTYDARKKDQRRGRRKQKGGSIGTILSSAAKAGYSLGKDKKYRRMSFSGFSDRGGNQFRTFVYP